MNLRKKFRFFSLFLSICIILSACNLKTGQSNGKTSNSKIETVNFKDDSKLTRDTISLSKTFGLKDVKSIKIDYQGYASVGGSNGSSNNTNSKPISDYILWGKELKINDPYVINQILYYLNYTHKVESDKKYNEEINKLNSDLKKIEEGDMLPNKEKLKKYQGYPIYNGSKKITPKKFEPLITLKSSDGEKVDIPFLLDSTESIVIIDKNSVALSRDAIAYFENLIDQDDINTNFSSDIYKMAKQNKLKISFRGENVEVKLPKEFKEDTYGDRYNLFWAYVNDLIKTENDSKDGLEKYKNQKVTLEKYYVSKADFSSFNYNNEKKSYDKINDPAAVVAIRVDDKLIGKFMYSISYPQDITRLDGKNLMELTNKSYSNWISSVMKNDENSQELSKLSSVDLIKKYYTMLDSGDNNANKLWLPKLSAVSGKVSQQIVQEVDEYKDNIDYLLIGDIKKSDIGVDSLEMVTPADHMESYITDIDVKFKREISTLNGQDSPIVTVVKLGDNKGYRIAGTGY
ncbi:MAG: hypothetical protein RR561_00880 [Peptostreptococcus sp.]|uniref:hypothetical protein n=1 Tax=Peptostreptococcus sp. TaxID=1262 RepID=UPI002FC5E027